jgi:signal transduction histidine kinase
MEEIKDNIPALVILAMTGTGLLVVSFILLYIRNQNKLLVQKKRLQEAEIKYQKELLHAVIASQEQERKRIGMDLHDEVGSALASLRMIVENFTRHDNPAPEAGAFNQQCKRIIDRVITDVRSISHNLSPLTRGAYGLTDAIEDLCDNINQSGRIQVSLELNANSILSGLADTTALALYRVLAELINNTIKHAQAQHISIAFTAAEGRLVIDYADDGKGISLPAGAMSKGMGMRNIESRLGMIGATYTFEGENRPFAMQIQLPVLYTENL